MSKSKKISSADELVQFINDSYQDAPHTNALYYLKYPFMDFIVEKPISLKQYNVLNKSKKGAVNGLYIQQGMNLLLGNYDEFRDIVKKIPDFLHAQNRDMDVFKNLVARKLSNLLSSTFAYTEYTRKLYHQIKSSPSFTSFRDKLITKDLSILEEVRNYAQHTGLPIHKFILDQNKFEIIIDLEILRETKEKNKQLLEDYPENEINITKILPLYINRLWLMHNKIIECIEKTLNTHFKNLEDAVSEIKAICKKENLNSCILVSTKEKTIEQLISLNVKELFIFYTKENYDIYNQYLRDS